MKKASRNEQIEQIRNEVLALTSSPLYHYRSENNYLPVIGDGSPEARIVFVGEAPGKNEALIGKPFCGAAGKVLDEALASIELERGDIFITNIVMDRPPKNRDPLPEEIASYGPYLSRLLEILQPQVIATLGRYAMTHIMTLAGIADQIETIGTAHGKTYTGTLPHGKVTIIPQYHPAATIYNRQLIPLLKEDFKAMKKYLDSQ